MLTTVVNKRTSSFDIYIGRGSIWGNPFVIGKDGSRSDVVQKHANWFTNQIVIGAITHSQLQSLKGKKLGCFCKPAACHGDTIAAIVNNLK